MSTTRSISHSKNFAKAGIPGSSSKLLILDQHCFKLASNAMLCGTELECAAYCRISVGGAARHQAEAAERAKAALSTGGAKLGPKVHRATQEIEYGGARHVAHYPQF